MTQQFQHFSPPKHARGRRRGSAMSIIGGILAFIFILAALGFSYWLYQHPGVIFDRFANNASSTASSEAEGGANPSGTTAGLPSDTPSMGGQPQGGELEEEVLPSYLPTPLVAEFEDVLIHTPVAPAELEGILFHQASFETAYVLSTQLPEANVEKMEENPDYKIAKEQPTGDEYLDAQALHLWREGADTAMDTSIDVGAEAGTQVYAPITGTVVLVNEYELYETFTDYEIHIQPDGRPNLDVVVIHISDVEVKAGDKVIGGVTPLARVRDIASEDITDIQLAYYTKEGHGNHTHVQVNNADYPEYRETRLKGAYKVED